MLSNVGLVGRVGQGRFMGTLFPWVTNPSLQAALNEAARTGLVLGMGAPSGEENWLRGVRQGPLATGVTGATYARSGTRAGLDPANSFAPNVVRREAGRGVRVFGAGTNLVRASEDISNGVWLKNNVTVTSTNVIEDTSNNFHRVAANYPAQTAGLAATVSVYVRSLGSARRLSLNFLAGGAAVALFDFSGAGSVIAVSGTAPNRAATITALGGGLFRCTVTGTTIAVNDLVYFQISRTSASTPAVDIYTGDGLSGFQFLQTQLELSSFATDYIPNASTVASASAGADDLVVGTGAGVTLGADHAFIIEGTVPDLIAGAFPAFIGWNASSESIGLFMTSVGQVGVNAGAGSVNLQGGPTLTAGQTVRALFRVSGGNTGRLFVNGVAAFANTAFTPSTGLASFFMGQTPTNTNRLGSGLSIAAVLLRAPSDAECLAITAL